MKSIRNLLVIVFLCSFSVIDAQLSTNEKPISFGDNFRLFDNESIVIPVIIMPELDMKKIEAEDRQDEEDDIPPRFGYQHKVNYNLNNSGIWHELPNGDRLWQLNIVCPNALSMNFCYDKFWIPEGGKFFVYSKDRKHSIGAFTCKNNKGGLDNISGFATGLIYSSDAILEYYQPKSVIKDAIISIEYVVHGYRFITLGERYLGSSGSCQVNVNCEEGQNWQNEKKAVSLILVNGNRYCTGSLINTTDLSQKPYLLTANHCLGGWANGNINHDAVTSPNLDHYSFWWNYEAPGCVNIGSEPNNYYSTSGAVVLANSSYSDFALLRLTEDPQNLTGYTPFYLGWDCSGQSGDAGVCIHHPKGDVKKISTVAAQPEIISFYSVDYWKVKWKSTLNGHGITQRGSSGSPLLNSAHRVIGQLNGAESDTCAVLNGHSWYGKFDLSWTGNDNSIYRRLNCWLDSLNIGVQAMEGLLVIPGTKTIINNEQIYSNIRITSTGQLIIQSDVEQMGNSRIIVESGGKLILDGGTLSNVELILKAGSFLRIINGGILETRNGLEVPLGSNVDIVCGQIL